MTTLINGRTAEQYAAWNRWHKIIAVLLALLLLLLWFMGRGPGSATAKGSCCGVAAPEQAAVATTPPEAAASVAAPSVRQPEDAWPLGASSRSRDQAHSPLARLTQSVVLVAARALRQIRMSHADAGLC